MTAAVSAKQTPVVLGLNSLDQLPKSIAVPTYARHDLKAGILHFGLGNFHRAHMAVYLDDLFNRGKAHDWAIVGAGVTNFDAMMRDRLKRQDWLSTVIEQDANGASARVTGVMTDFIDPADRETIVTRMIDPAIRIVSLTITEGGYFIDPATGQFDAQHAAIEHDARNPETPETVFGLIMAGLKRRKAAGVAPFTVMSCDNVPHNGVVTRNALVGLAQKSDPAFAGWIETNVAFPNAMVDRITPATGDRERALALQHYGIVDASPVFCEPFRQWVVEDRFPTGRPPLEEVGVTFVHDVTPFEFMKIRILNGGHAVIAYPAGLLGITFVDEAMAHPLIAGFLDKIERDEIIPQVPPVPNTNLADYHALIIERFANPKVGDTVRRLCLDGSNRQPKFIVPTIADALKYGGKFDGLALESALWCRYCAGQTDTGEAIAPNDPSWERLNATAIKAQSDPMIWLAMEDIYGPVSMHEGFCARFAFWLNGLKNEGVEHQLRLYLGKTE
jgi:mannitol 2-dehydrogenase